jgi:cysteine desulfurase
MYRSSVTGGQSDPGWPAPEKAGLTNRPRGGILDPIYLDNAATTPLRPEVFEAMRPYWSGEFGNPSSPHRWGRAARAALEDARERVATTLGAQRAEIIFSGCGTESDNLAVLGAWRASGRTDAAVACSAVEHKAVLRAAKAAHREGAPLILLAVDDHGRVDAGLIDEALSQQPAVVSVMWGNNEVGTIQPVSAIGQACRNAGVPFHTDAVQAFGKVRVRVDETPCDLLALSAHKFGGPKGTGILYVREGTRIDALEHGGGQERQLRPGTENVAGAVGLARAMELAAAEQASEATRLGTLRDRLEHSILENVPGAQVNGGGKRLPHILHLSIPGLDQEAFVVALDVEGIAVSVASACQSGASEPSHVLSAMGRVLSKGASVRVSLGHATTSPDIDRAAEIIPAVANRVLAAA